MDLLSNLQKRYHDLLSPVQQGLSQVGKAINSNPIAKTIANTAVRSVAPMVANNNSFTNAFSQAPKVDLTSKIKNPYLKLGASIPESIINSPRNTAQGMQGLNQQASNMYLKGQLPRPQTLLSNVGKSLDLPLNLMGGSLLKSTAKGVAEQGFKQVGKQGLLNVMKEGTLEGGKLGTAFGLSGGLQSGENINNPFEYAKNLGMSTLEGTVGGALIGGLGAGGMYGVNKGVNEINLIKTREALTNFHNDIKSGTIANSQNPVYQKYSKALGINSKTENTILQATQRLANKMDDPSAEFVLERSKSLLPPEFRDQPTPEIAKAWSHIIARKNNRAIPGDVPLLTQDLDKAIFSQFKQGGKITLGASVGKDASRSNTQTKIKSQVPTVEEFVNQSPVLSTKIPSSKSVSQIQKEVGGELNQLIKEAKKYKSAAEFESAIRDNKNGVGNLWSKYRKNYDDPNLMGMWDIYNQHVKSPLKSHTQLGSATNTRADQIAGKYRIKDARQSTPTESVLDEVKAGFDKGRKARESAQNQAQGSVSQRARTEFVDRLSPVYDFVKDGKKIGAENNPYKKMRLLAGISGKVEAYADKYVRPILTKEKDRTSDLSALWALERERELVGTKGLMRKRTAEQVEQGINELRTKYGDEGFRTLQESSQQLRKVGDDLLIQLKDAGIIDEASYNAIKAKNQFYAPMEAVEHMADAIEKGYGSGSFSVASQDVVKGIKSYTGDVGDPIEALVRRIPKVIALVEKNKAIKSFVDLRKVDKELYGNLIVPIKGDPPKGMGIINVFENGQNNRYAVPEVVESAIKNLDAQSAGMLVKLGGWQAKILRAGATGLNIGFIPVNIVRDVQDALTTELSENGAKSMLRFLASYPHAILSAAGKGKLYQEWAANGGLQSTMLEQIAKKTPKTVAELSGKRNLFKTVINSPVSAVEFLNRVGEQSTRLARFKSGIAGGEDVTEAAFKSRDISLDFAKAGNSVKVLNQVIPFLNAGIQGSEKLARLYRTNPVAATASTSLMFGLPTVMLYQHNSQFKDYQDVPDSEKQNNWLIIARDRTPEEIAANEKVIGIKIPKGFLGRIVSNSAESAMAFANNRDPQTFLNFGLDTLEGISPVGLPVDKERFGRTLSRIAPPALKAGIEGITNTNLYFGSKIVPQSLENLPPSEQYREKTPGIYKAAGQITGQSPLILENTVNSMTGGLGRQAATFFSGDVKGGTIDQVTRRFSGIQGGVNSDKAWETVEKEKQYTALRNKQLKEAYSSGNMEEFKRLSDGMSKEQIKTFITNQKKEGIKPEMSYEEKAYDTLTKEEKTRLLKERPELKSSFSVVDQAGAAGNSPMIQDNMLIGKTGEIIDLTPPSKGNGIASFANRDWNITKAREVWNSEDHTKEQKDAAFKKLGVKAEDVRYDALANYTNDIKTQYLTSKSNTKEKLIQNITSGRKRSIGDNIFASDGVIDTLVDEGKLTKEEGKALKAIDYNKDGTLKGTVGKGKKVKMPKVKAISIKFSKGKRIKVKAYKPKKVKQYKLTKVSKLKKVKRLKV